MKKTYCILSPNSSLSIGLEVWCECSGSFSQDPGEGNHLNGKQGWHLSVLSLSVLPKDAIFLRLHCLLCKMETDKADSMHKHRADYRNNP